MKDDYSLSRELLKVILKPGYIYFLCSDGEVYSAPIGEAPSPKSRIIIPILEPGEEIPKEEVDDESISDQR